MSANVETMMYVKKNESDVPWHGLGKPVKHALSSAQALEDSGMDWIVTSEPIYVNGEIVPNYRANVRSSDGSVFGIVTNKYKIVQNHEAFAFTDFLLKNDMGIPVEYETAGALDGGKRVWLLAKLPPERVLGDDIVPYLVFTNSHDGKGAIRIAVTPTRVVCQNTLNAALKSAPRTWSTRHMGDISSKMKEAEHTLLRTKAYMEGLNETAEKLQQTHVTPDILNEFMNQIFPIDIAASERLTNNNLELRDTLLNLYNNKDDLQKFHETGWGLYNALADFESHSLPQRASSSFRARKFTSLVDGNSRLEAAENFLVSV